jgi:hypothetical protein
MSYKINNSPIAKNLWLVLTLSLTLVFSACENDVGPLIIEPLNPETVSFSQDIQPIFDIHCTGCHDEFHQFLDLSSCCSYDQLLNSGSNAPYVIPDDPEQSRLYLHLTGDLLLMPLFGPLPDHEIELVLKWIEEGALDN